MEEKKSAKNTSDEKKIKNLISAVILLAGLFVGSLFVDFAQLVRGTGFSERNLGKTEIFEANGKTWVAYNEPKVDVQVLTDETCGEECDPSEALVWLRRVIPTISAQKINYDSGEGKKIVEKFQIKTLPSFIFSDEVEKTDFYSQAQILFEERGNEFLLKNEELGLAPGRYLSTPQINEGEASLGNSESSVKVAVFSDFQCPYCKIFWSTLRNTAKEYEDRILVGYKHLVLPIHSQANNSALASECALEQGKFWEYGDKLFAKQSEWPETEGKQKFKDYAQELGLDSSRFNDCLDKGKYQDKIDKNMDEAISFGVSGTPATFINGQFKNGVVSGEELKAAIDQELAK
ncbi:MAG TPA: hypothetical protein DIT25_02655 [Candidatus Moranbacteria bacterium]|nr:hypothetical protein [Candidatus Moranbacteria bacterium]